MASDLGLHCLLTALLWVPGKNGSETKIIEFVTSIDLDEGAHIERPRLDLHCLPSILWILNMI